MTYIKTQAPRPHDYFELSVFFPLMPTDLLPWLKLAAVLQNLKVLGVGGVRGGMEDPSQQQCSKFRALSLCIPGREDQQHGAYPHPYSAGTGQKCVLLVPSSGQSVAERKRRFFTLSWVFSAFEKLFLQLVCCLAAGLGTAFDSRKLVLSLLCCLKPL